MENRLRRAAGIRPLPKEVYNALQRGNNAKATRLIYPYPHSTYSMKNILTMRKNLGYKRNTPVYNANKLVVKKNSNANANLKKAFTNGNLSNMLLPLRNNRGAGINPYYLKGAMKGATRKWALVNKNTGEVRAFALAGNLRSGSGIEIDLFGALPTHGSKLMNEIKKNVNHIVLNSVANNFYRKQGFKHISEMTMEWRKTLKRKRNNNRN
jgi:hypothetical protein